MEAGEALTKLVRRVGRHRIGGFDFNDPDCYRLGLMVADQVAGDVDNGTLAVLCGAIAPARFGPRYTRAGYEQPDRPAWPESEER